MVDDKGYNLAFHSTLFVQEQRFRCPATSSADDHWTVDHVQRLLSNTKFIGTWKDFLVVFSSQELILHSDPLDGGWRLGQTDVESSGEIENLC